MEHFSLYFAIIGTSKIITTSLVVTEVGNIQTQIVHVLCERKGSAGFVTHTVSWRVKMHAEQSKLLYTLYRNINSGLLDGINKLSLPMRFCQH